MSEKEKHIFLDFAKRNDFHSVRRLIQSNEDFVNVQPKGRWSALHQFSQRGNLEAVKFLLDHGADPGLTNRDGNTPAEVTKDWHVKEMLIAKAASSLRGSSSPDPSRLGHQRSSMIPLPEDDDALAMVKGACPFRTEAELKEAVRKAGGDPDLALEGLLENPPNICEDPNKWFRHFDLTGDGYLQEHEVTMALWHSLGPDVHRCSIAKQVRRKWADVAPDDLGAVSYDEFVEEGGLRDWITETWSSALQRDAEFQDCEEEGDGDEEAGKKDGTAFLNAALDSLEPDGILGVYFAAHSIRPFDAFTRVLEKRYRRYRERGLHFHVMFVSMDKAAAASSAVTDWKPVAFSDQPARLWLVKKLGVRAVPQLVLLTKAGSIRVKDACTLLEEDEEGTNFPVVSADEPADGGSKEAAEVMKSKLRSVVQMMVGKRPTMESPVDDVELARTAARAPLTEEGYKQVAAFKSNYAMKHFAQRVIATKQWCVLDNAALTKLIWEHSGVMGTKSLERLIQDLKAAKWVVEADSGDSEGGVPALATATFTKGGSAASGSGPPTGSMPGLRTQAFRHAYFKSVNVDKFTKSVRRPPGGTIREDAEGTDDSKTRTASEEQPPLPAPVASDMESEKAGPEAATSEGEGKVPVKGKGPGKAAPGKGKGPGKTAPGKSKGPGAPPGEAGGYPATAAAPLPSSGDGKTGGKGPPPPKAPSAPKGAGKGPLPLAGGKGRGKGLKGKKGGPQPTREECTEWKDKKKNPLRWKRVLQDDGIFDGSLFAGAEPEIVNEDALEDIFTKAGAPEVAARDLRLEPEAAVKKEKPFVWDSTEKQSAGARRQMIAIMMKAWSGNAPSVFLQRLEELEIDAIRLDPDFKEDRFNSLAQWVEQMSAAEWGRLVEKDADRTYVWDKDVEGFFLRLKGCTNFEMRVGALKLGLMIQSELDALVKESSVLNDSIEEVLKSAVIRLVFQKILSIGNRLNAGEAKYGRADGFDVVDLLEKTDFLQSYKGAASGTPVNLLKHLQDNELTDQVEAIVQLSSELQGIQWKPPNALLAGAQDDAPDPTDVGELRKRSQDICRALGDLSKVLNKATLLYGSCLHFDDDPGSTDDGLTMPPSACKAAKWLRQVEEICKIVEENQKKSIEVDSELDTVEESLKQLHRFLAHQPPKKKELVAGHSLGPVVHFVRLLGTAPVVHKRRRCTARSGRAPRRSMPGSGAEPQ